MSKVIVVYIGCLLIAIHTQIRAQSTTIVMADSLAGVGNYSKAIKAYKTLPALSPLTALKIARAYKALGNSSAALDYYSQCVASNPDWVIATTEYAKLLINQRQFTLADSIFRQLTRRYPNNPDFYYQHGRILKTVGPQQYIDKGDTLVVRAKDAFAKAVSLDSTHQKAMYQLGLTYLKKQQYDKVEQLGNTALKTDATNVEILSLLAISYYTKGWNSEAIFYFEKLIALGQSTPYIHTRLARAYAKQGDYEKSIAEFAKVIQEEDKDPGIHLELARVYQRSGDYLKGIRHSEIALVLQSQPIDDTYYTLATLFKLNKEFQKAVTHYQLALQENPERIDAHYGIAVAADNYYKDKKEVLVLYEEFVAAFKDQTDVRNSYYVRLAQQRIDILTKEIFMAGTKD